MGRIDRKGAVLTAEIASLDLTPLGGQWRPVRLATLIWLRWLGIAGQSVALIVVSLGFGFDLPILPAAALVLLAAILNIGLSWRFGSAHRLATVPAAVIVQRSLTLPLRFGFRFNDRS